MSLKLTKENTKKLPDGPGVYFFLDEKKKVLYVGKATSLRQRVRSYLKNDIIRSRGPLIMSLMEKAKKIDYEKTDSVLEALILEAKYIKQLKPHHNTREKSDKSFNYVIITKEDFPRVLLARERELLMGKIDPKDIKYSFGPFPHGTILRDALRIVRKIFPFRDTCTPASKANNGIELHDLDEIRGSKETSREPYKAYGERRGDKADKEVRQSMKLNKPCFNAQIGLCPGVCAGRVDTKEYAKTINHLRLFFEGKKKALIKQLEREMKGYAKAEAFEKAEMTKRKIFALHHIQDVSLLRHRSFAEEHFGERAFRIESYDIAHLSGQFAVGVMTVIENGDAKKSDYRKFRIKSFKGADDTRALREVLDRRLGHIEWPLPQLFVIDGGKAQRTTALSVLKEAGIEIPVVSVVKDEHHRPRGVLGDGKIRREYHDAILLANSEAHRFAIKYHKQLRDKIKK